MNSAITAAAAMVAYRQTTHRCAVLCVERVYLLNFSRRSFMPFF
jgi:hypothetical protein